MELSKFCVDSSAEVLTKSLLQNLHPEQLRDLSVYAEKGKMSTELALVMSAISYDVLKHFILTSKQDKINTIIM